MKKIRFRIRTVDNIFVFGFGWSNYSTHEYRAGFVLGFVAFDFFWNKPMSE